MHINDTGGSGRPVILIHAWPLCSEVWSPQLPALRDAGYRVITYDRRGFGRSDHPQTGYTYDQLAADLHAIIDARCLFDVSLVGFSMGGGEIARYVSAFGTRLLHSVVFASSVTPYMLRTADNPGGPLPAEGLGDATAALIKDSRAFYKKQVDEFFDVNGECGADSVTLTRALRWCEQASVAASLACMAGWAKTDFRTDLEQVNVPTLIVHGDADVSVPFDGSAWRTHQIIPGSRLHRISRGPHGCNITHAEQFNAALINFLGAQD